MIGHSREEQVNLMSLMRTDGYAGSVGVVGGKAGADCDRLLLSSKNTSQILNPYIRMYYKSSVSGFKRIYIGLKS